MKPPKQRLIQNVEVNARPHQDVLIADGCIAALGEQLPLGNAEVIDGQGDLLLPGLKDHHMHLVALAVSKNSLNCSPQHCPNADALSTALQADLSDGWLRGIQYHPSVAGELDVAWLDQHGPQRPIRIQHQGGRLWVFNSIALARLQVSESDPFERIDGQLSGRLYEGDAWLRERMTALGEARRPDLRAVSEELAAYGITGLTDTSPSNDMQALQWFSSAQASGELIQDVLMMGDASLDGAVGAGRVTVGAHKFHLLESALPDFEETVAAIRQSHSADRNAAFHCVTRTELAFALSALEDAGVKQGDRIEHASVTPPEWLEKIRQLGLIVVTQPALIRERGDRYLRDVDAEDQPWLYRLKGFIEAGIPLAGSSDAPYTQPNPWQAMQSAIDRCSLKGTVIGPEESLSPEQALNLYTSPLETPACVLQTIAVGQKADLCLMDAPWAGIRSRLAEARPRLVLKAGNIITPSG